MVGEALTCVKACTECDEDEKWVGTYPGFIPDQSPGPMSRSMLPVVRSPVKRCDLGREAATSSATFRRITS
eukprot:7318029-Prymnesium_polylepis.2